MLPYCAVGEVQKNVEQWKQSKDDIEIKILDPDTGIVPKILFIIQYVPICNYIFKFSDGSEVEVFVLGKAKEVEDVRSDLALIAAECTRNVRSVVATFWFE